MSLQNGCESEEYWDRLRRQERNANIFWWCLALTIIGVFIWLSTKYWSPGLMLVFVGALLVGIIVAIYNYPY